MARRGCACAGHWACCIMDNIWDLCLAVMRRLSTAPRLTAAAAPIESGKGQQSTTTAVGIYIYLFSPAFPLLSALGHSVCQTRWPVSPAFRPMAAAWFARSLRAPLLHARPAAASTPGIYHQIGYGGHLLRPMSMLSELAALDHTELRRRVRHELRACTRPGPRRYGPAMP